MKRAIHCTTQEQWNHVLEVFEKKGWRWADDTIPLAHIQNWEVYKTKSGINYCDGFCYCEVNYLKSRNYQILSYEEFLEEEGLWKLPERWCIRGNKEVYEWFLANNPRKYSYNSSLNWFHSDNTKWGTKYIKSGSKDDSHTEITFDQFKKYVLNQKIETMEKKFVKVVNDDKAYTTHSNAKEYGLTNYHYWKNLPKAKNGDILEIVKEVIVNVNDPSYILKDKNGIEYLIAKDGVIDCEEKEKEIIGYKLKEECKQYLEAAEIIADAKVDFKKGVSLEYFLKKEKWGNFKENLEKAGVLNIWFEPVYADEFKVGDYITFTSLPTKYVKYNGETVKIIRISEDNRHKYWYNHEPKSFSGGGFGYEAFKDCFRKATPEEIKNASTPNITVNEYKGEFFDWGVKFGCAEFDKELFTYLNSRKGRTNRDIESVTIGKGTFTKDQIREIAEYYLSGKIDKL